MIYFIKYSKHIMITLFIILLGEAALYLFYSSAPLQDTFGNLFLSTIDSIKSQIETETAQLKKRKKELEKYSGGSRINLNYFTGERIVDDLSPLLKDINDYANIHGVEIIAIEPMPLEEKENYLKRSFFLSVSSQYKNIVRFISALEKKGGLSTGGFEVNRGKEGKDKFTFTVSAFKVKNNRLTRMGRRYISGEKGEDTDNILIDPFKSLIEKSSEKIETIKDIQEFDENISDLSVDAIIDVGGKKSAIINHQIVGEGDLIENARVLLIKGDTVTLKKKQKIYRLKLYDLHPVVENGVSPQIKMGRKDMEKFNYKAEVKDKPKKLFKSMAEISASGAAPAPSFFSVVVASCVSLECSETVEKRLQMLGLLSVVKKLPGPINTYSIVIDEYMEKDDAEAVKALMLVSSKNFIFKNNAENALKNIVEKGYKGHILNRKEEMMLNKVMVGAFDNHEDAADMSIVLNNMGFDSMIYDSSASSGS